LWIGPKEILGDDTLAAPRDDTIRDIRV
jgi:hypothetical protein